MAILAWPEKIKFSPDVHRISFGEDHLSSGIKNIEGIKSCVTYRHGNGCAMVERIWVSLADFKNIWNAQIGGEKITMNFRWTICPERNWCKTQSTHLEVFNFYTGLPQDLWRLFSNRWRNLNQALLNLLAGCPMVIFNPFLLPCWCLSSCRIIGARFWIFQMVTSLPQIGLTLSLKPRLWYLFMGWRGVHIVVMPVCSWTSAVNEDGVALCYICAAVGVSSTDIDNFTMPVSIKI